MILIKKARIYFTLLLSVLILANCLYGCDKKDSDTPTSSELTTAKQTTTESKISDDTEDSGAKITDDDVTLTYWLELAAGKVTEVITNMNESRLYQEMYKRTGVKIEFLHPPTGQAQEQFNLMISSLELPDIIEYNWNNYPGGPEKAVSDGIIVELNDLIDKYSPHYKKFLEENEDVAKQAKTDSGKLCAYPFIFETPWMCVSYGPMARKDWLEELDIPIPETLDDWYNMLVAFRDKKGATAPFTFELWRFEDSSCIVGAFGVGGGFYVDNGIVKYGPAEQPYKDYLALMNKWYSEGLLDRDFASQDLKAVDAKITGGKTGAFAGLQGGQMGNYLNMMYGKGTSFDLVGLPYPSLKPGEKVKFCQLDWRHVRPLAAITTANKYPEISAKYLDYGYSPEGLILFNWGIENESFVEVDGKKQYVDKIRNPEKGSMANALSYYVRIHWNAPFVSLEEPQRQYSSYQQQLDAREMWAKAASYDTKLPSLTPLPEETSELASKLNEVKTHQQEMFLKFIMGDEPLDKFDDYVEQLNRLGLQDVLRIYNSAMDRYKSR